MKWFKQTVFYEIYIKSFADGNGDGIGDFPGLTERLDYLAELGIGGIWLTPFYPSMQVDNGYDVSDYCAVDPLYGTLADFKVFLAEAKKREIRVVIDMVLNHTAINHRWFTEHPDYYIWKERPNNWTSFFGGSAFQFDEKREQYYYHSFAKEQADLNWANPAVKEEIKQVLKFWLALGVDGFRFDVINNLTLDLAFPDNPVDELGEVLHKFDKDQPGIDGVMAELAAFCRDLRPDVFLVGEISSDELPEIARYSRPELLDVTFNFNFGSIETFTPEKLFQELVAMEKALPDGQMPTLFFGSHDMGRSFSRLAGQNLPLAELLAFIILTARGVPFIYNGEEAGMTDLTFADVSEMADIQGIMAYEQAVGKGETKQEALFAANQKTRDKARGPMIFADGKAFSATGKAWLKQNQEPEEKVHAIFAYYQELLAFRKAAAYVTEPYTSLQLKEACLTYQRGNYYFVANFSERWQMTAPPNGRLVFGQEEQGGIAPLSGAIYLMEEENENCK
ncbi:alpha-amylase family glycosyl hydrolase [Listeria costaricensis]|uniref:alpha-amylase family glycosyl hydrolase n=1 Tax=Listeria costaricensis TaxID=2026604 RepID=UPI000C0698A2|nr:alpha-amylase family glycosyl hydrolase [Listeria costaricensis]